MAIKQFFIGGVFLNPISSALEFRQNLLRLPGIWQSDQSGQYGYFFIHNSRISHPK